MSAAPVAEHQFVNNFKFRAMDAEVGLEDFEDGVFPVILVPIVGVVFAGVGIVSPLRPI